MKPLLTLIVLLLGTLVFSQDETNVYNPDTLNYYKYVVIPNQFEFLKGKDTYQLNSLTKFLFNRKGFEAYLEDDELPQDLFDDRCLALYAEVVEGRGGFRQKKLKVVIRDCYKSILFESRVGSSGENNHEKAHQLSLRDAFVTIDLLNYQYKPKISNEAATSTTVELQSTEQLNTVVSASEAAVAVTTPISGSTDAINMNKQVYAADSILNLVSRNYGYDIKDLNEEVIMILLETNAEGIYLVKGKDAIVYVQDDKWIMSSNNGETVSKQVLNIDN